MSNMLYEEEKQRITHLINEVQATIVRNEGGDCSHWFAGSAVVRRRDGTVSAMRTLLSVLDELDTDTFTNGRVGLFGLNSDLFENDTFGVGRTTGRGRTVSGSKGTLLVVVVGLQQTQNT